MLTNDIESKVIAYHFPVEVDIAHNTVAPAGDHPPSVVIEDTHD